MLDKHEEAMHIHREVLAIKKAKYGPDDRSTLITMINLANVYHPSTATTTPSSCAWRRSSSSKPSTARTTTTR